MSTKQPAILSIAGFDSSGGAGIIADAAVFRALGFHPLTVLTSVAAQGVSRVAQIHGLTLDFIHRQLELVMQDFQPQAVKIGMLYSDAAVLACANFIKDQQLPAVLDPVMWASSGRNMIRPSALRSLSRRLIPLCRLITPNLREARVFLHVPITTIAQAEQVAQRLARRWETWVLLKGGHLPGAPVDILSDGNRIMRYSHPRIAEGKNLRGTGCALSAAAAVGLAQGKPVPEAVGFAENFIERAIRNHYVAAKDEGVGFLGFKA